MKRIFCFLAFIPLLCGAQEAQSQTDVQRAALQSQNGTWEATLDKWATQPFSYSVAAPDGNYRVTVTLGNRKRAGETVVRAESRRHYYDVVQTKKGEYKTVTFMVNKHSPRIDDKTSVRLKPREVGYKNWDDSLTISFCGPAPAVKSI